MGETGRGWGWALGRSLAGRKVDERDPGKQTGCSLRAWMLGMEATWKKDLRPQTPTAYGVMGDAGLRLGILDHCNPQRTSRDKVAARNLYHG